MNEPAHSSSSSSSSAAQQQQQQVVRARASRPSSARARQAARGKPAQQ
jgi:hypothetical protein